MQWFIFWSVIGMFIGAVINSSRGHSAFVGGAAGVILGPLLVFLLLLEQPKAPSPPQGAAEWKSPLRQCPACGLNMPVYASACPNGHESPPNPF